MHHCEVVRDCMFCKFLSRTFGRLLMFLMCKKWPKLERKRVVPLMKGLDLELVGGLKTRGWTIHDIDVAGDIMDVPKFIERVEKEGIQNPVHFCDYGFKKHSHLLCIKDGLGVIFYGNKMYGNIKK